MKKSVIKGLVVLALAFSVPVFSDTTEDLVNALVTKGILTEDEAALHSCLTLMSPYSLPSSRYLLIDNLLFYILSTQY